MTYAIAALSGPEQKTRDPGRAVSERGDGVPGRAWAPPRLIVDTKPILLEIGYEPGA